MSGRSDRLAESIARIERLVAFDTESSKSNLALIGWIETELSRQSVPYVILPNRQGDKAAIFATFGPMIDGGVVLSGHTDVVPVEGQTWTSDPFKLRRQAGRLYGRGACDMKGFVGVVLAMAEEFLAAPLRRPIHLLFTYDEETTCLGPIDAIERFGEDLPKPGAVIVGEPTSMQVADAHKGVACYVTRVIGKEAHSSRPALGASAIETACELVAELYRIGLEFSEGSSRFDPPGSTLNVGSIRGGSARNILAGECAFQWEFRGEPDVSQDIAARRLARYVAERALPRLLARAPQGSIETKCEVAVPGLRPEPGSAAEALAFRLTRSNRTIAVPFATEAGRFQHAGASVAICGPGNIDQAHQPDEFIELDQLDACIAFMRSLVAELSQSA
jgi:acetylornithine deacetylase